jgi:hypothetical protein
LYFCGNAYLIGLSYLFGHGKMMKKEMLFELLFIGIFVDIMVLLGFLLHGLLNLHNLLNGFFSLRYYSAECLRYEV